MAGQACTYCGGTEADPGFLRDAGNGSRGAVTWIVGNLERGLFGGARVMGKKRLEISGWRCRKCGHLELFAF